MEQQRAISKEEIQQVAKVFDSIRNLHKQYNPSGDKDLLNNFQQKIVGTVKSLSQEASPTPSQILKSKNELWEYCAGQLLSYLQKSDSKCGSVLNQVLKALTENFKQSITNQESMQTQLDNASQELLQKSKELDQVLSAAEELEKQVQHLKRENSQRAPVDEDVMEQMRALQEENKSYLDKIISLSKQAADKSVKTPSTSPPKKDITPRGSKKLLPKKQAEREITLKQLKDCIEDIYVCKAKFDEKCTESKQPRETMDQYLLTYLNHKYGLKSLINEWANGILKCIEKHEATEPDVALFAKILRHELDEEFKTVVSKLKDTVKQVLKLKIQSKFPYMGEAQINNIVKEKVTGGLEEDEWKGILTAIYTDEEAEYIAQQIEDLVDKKSAEVVTKKRGVAKFRTLPSYTEVLNAVLFYDLFARETLLGPFQEKFQLIDSDKDGIVDEEQFKELMASLNLLEESESFLDLVDPHAIGSVTFSDCVRLFEEQRHPHSETYSILHFLFQENKSSGNGST